MKTIKVEKLKELINLNPNDAALGAAVRSFVDRMTEKTIDPMTIDPRQIDLYDLIDEANKRNK